MTVALVLSSAWLAIATTLHSSQGQSAPDLAERCAESTRERPEVVAAVLRAISLKDDRAASAALDALEQPLKAAAEAAPLDATAQYDLALVLAGRSDREGGRKKIAAAVQLQSQAQRVIALVPDHAGAHYLLARLYAALKRLDGLTRFVASRMLGGKALLNPPWPAIQSLFEIAERSDPCEAEHHYELARAYEEQRLQAKLEVELQHVLALTANGDSRWLTIRRQAEAWLAAGKRPRR